MLVPWGLVAKESLESEMILPESAFKSKEELADFLRRSEYFGIGVVNELQLDHYGDSSLRAAGVEALIHRGISLDAMMDPSPIKKARVRFLRCRRFEYAYPDEAGPDVTKAITIPSFDEDGVLIDVVAWCPADDRFASLYGTCPVLGADVIAFSHVAGLSVFRSPLNWLRTNRNGVVLIDKQAAAWRLAGIPVFGEDAAHDEELDRLLTIRPVLSRRLSQRETA